MKHLAQEPRLELKDLALTQKVSWEDVDVLGSSLLKRAALAIPSVRVGLCWGLEYLKSSRHKDHVLLPKYVGRCILNTLNRVALPVETLTPQTRYAVIIDQYGLKQDLNAIQQELKKHKIAYLEDSPYGVSTQEALGPGSVARFIGLSKVLPVVQGALVISEDAALLEFISKKRNETSPLSWLVWNAGALLRKRSRVPNSSIAAEVLYELYPHGKGGNNWLRGNMLEVLRQKDHFIAESEARLGLLEQACGKDIIKPDLNDLGYVVPLLAGENTPQKAALFREFSFDETIYNVDLNRNLFSPRFEKVFLVPLNPRIPREHYEKFVRRLKETLA